MPLGMKFGGIFCILLITASGAAAQCDISASALSFGDYSYRRDATSNGSLSVSCDAGTVFSIELSKGSGDYARRSMQGVGQGTLTYNLYTRPDYQEVWGDGVAPGTQRVTGIGSGEQQVFTVFGLIPRGQTPPPGQYFDSVTITIKF